MHQSTPDLTSNLTNIRSISARKTFLGQLCGTTELFRDRYQILKILGRGGFGITFLVRDVSLPGHPLCVIKQLCPKVQDDVALKLARQRFEKEARTLSKLGSHAQIPCLLDYFEWNGEFYLVQEFVYGVNLAKEVRRYGLWSEKAVKQFLQELLPLLQYIHNNHVIHRDIKPHNLIRSRDDGRLVLIDFGAVKEQVLASETGSAGTAATQFVGTIGFAPPEQLANRPVYASDLYAVGMTCLFLLSGRAPLELDYDFATGEVCWQHDIAVSPHFESVLTKLVKNSPKERYQSAAEVLRVLDLEPYVDNLKHCMNIKPEPFLSEPGADDTLREPYVPPIVRAANAIHGWRERIQARERRREFLQAPTTYRHLRSVSHS